YIEGQQASGLEKQARCTFLGPISASFGVLVLFQRANSRTIPSATHPEQNFSTNTFHSNEIGGLTFYESIMAASQRFSRHSTYLVYAFAPRKRYA
ncbi:MAG: hypothetical protein AB7U29_20445, partial [Desulfobulbus sp.]